VLFTLEATAPAQRYLILPWTELVARMSYLCIWLFDPTVGLRGVVIENTHTHFAVAIRSGCNGVEATIVLIAAIFATVAPRKHKIWGLVLGFLAVQILNIVRVITLFYLGQWDYTAFQWAHLYIWQVLIILDILIVWLVWLRTLPKAAHL